MDDRNVVVSLQTGCSFQKHPNLRRGGHDTTRVERGPDLFQTKKRKFLHKWEAMMANLDGVLASKTGKVNPVSLFWENSSAGPKYCCDSISKKKFCDADGMHVSKAMSLLGPIRKYM